MDVFSLLSYINKVSLFAFFITTLIVGYQIYILKNEKSREQTPIIPDFKEKNNSNVVANYTNLPNYLLKKELKSVNYSKLIFFIISLITIIIIIFVTSLIKKNNSTPNQASINPPVAISPTSTLIPTSIPSPTEAVITEVPLIEVPTISPTVVPTEIILAKNPSLTPTNIPTEPVVTNKPQVLPETGSWGKGLLMIGVAVSTIFFSFWF